MSLFGVYVIQSCIVSTSLNANYSVEVVLHCFNKPDPIVSKTLSKNEGGRFDKLNNSLIFDKLSNLDFFPLKFFLKNISGRTAEDILSPQIILTWQIYKGKFMVKGRLRDSNA